MRSYLKVLIISMLGLILFIPSALADNAVKRVGGSNRYGTAAALSKQVYSTASTAVVVGGGSYADAISAAPMAYQKNAPLLYTNKDNLSAETKTRLKELKTKTVIIVGGTPAVSANTANQIKALGISVKRISGSNRYDTAAKVAMEMPAASKAVIANGFLYADAIAAIPYAAMNGYPILFTNQTDINSATAGAIKSKGIKSSIVAGGTGSINASVFNKLPSPKRISGSNRYELAANLVQQLNLPTGNVFVSNGFGYADSIAGAALAAKKKQSIILTNGSNLSKETRVIIGRKKLSSFTIIGNTPAVSSNVANQLKNPVSGKTILIDPGHGDQDSGSIGNGILEKDVNLDIGKRLNTKLNASGALPVMTRSNDTFYSLQERVNKGATAGADLFISVHGNANDATSANGTETYYDETYQAAASKRLAEQIQPKVVNALSTRDRGVKTAPFYVIKYSKMPSVLVETAFITNPSDASKLKQASYKEKTAAAINDGIVSYYK
ncbi:N-acetylmuramoyl-L-alanine amidase [Bacillus amyloliquefaciens]|uniref:N-acetylmuramoyl-L-alanine amidase (Major autolysin) n=1 Tax=Bacillus amyloliquefaciens (strain ATCC 23350 / DSM 7 / BCRC 11601 / CCUG 28519 / NBRC 15535 / NRRL B-14393 / F) TaxID=692420 RepID=A0A9P1NJB8_BACAS|nr:N-acetylmuramoyl-L-alanine amidase [Bacillus amyloliquefaciens]ARW40759.1 N-acetylmuramoyl-L-alanine amidase [Bacillus amyloliquefaciens]AZV90900.1 N-acetylmuramoyl-L-alanine amidase [Bacillus amyloliquefaciens]MDR4376195.1 N-acetylmuramoyl-L-alanine amidase [Bacillus amyloliquefaciens]MEC1840410.1 N-acetylmuramoyl-L-alanine amidase [Bacillus amyloliquefaciens]MEC1848760.1 N-acetylmuramoyl-L-alanine amidase [Bacillus amyloliquefaciens]